MDWSSFFLGVAATLAFSVVTTVAWAWIENRRGWDTVTDLDMHADEAIAVTRLEEWTDEDTLLAQEAARYHRGEPA